MAEAKPGTIAAASAEAARAGPATGKRRAGSAPGEARPPKKLPLEQAKHAKTKLWLLRLPPRVAQLWADAPADADLGELEIHAGDKLTVELAGDGRGGPVPRAIPSNFSLTVNGAPARTFAFARQGGGGGAAAAATAGGVRI